MSPTETSQLELFNQIQHNVTSTNQALYVYFLSLAPFSIDWKLKIYYWLMSLPISHMSPTFVTFFIGFSPLFLVLIVYILFKIALWIYRTIIPLVARIFIKEDTEKKILEITFPADTGKSAYATEQLHTLIHSLSRQSTFWERLAKRKTKYSLEIVSTKKEGIRYLIIASPYAISIISRNIRSYLPGVKLKEVDDYLSTYIKDDLKKDSLHFLELKLTRHFSLPLNTQKTLSENDPISYLTGQMTRLDVGEIISYQIVVSPVLHSVQRRVGESIEKLSQKIYKGQPLVREVHKPLLDQLSELPIISIVWLLIKLTWKVATGFLFWSLDFVSTAQDSSGKAVSWMSSQPRPQDILNPYEKELAEIIKDKISKPLFETSIRVLFVIHDKSMLAHRMNGLRASFGQMESSYQGLDSKTSLFHPISKKLDEFINRKLSLETFLNRNPVLSVSELSDLHHFPYTNTTKTEDMLKVHSQDLPAPLSAKNNSNLDVVFGKNTYGNEDTCIGLTDEDRSRHVYTIGQTGSGKTTIMFHMAHDDIQKGRGLAVLDPHGDLAEDLLTCVPDERIDDCIYFNPFDLRYPVGVNILEIDQTLEGDELEQEKELVCESVVSVFKRVFSKDENTDAHRIEYILRNTIYTAFTVKDATIFTVYELLNNPKFQKIITAKLEDENLKSFWKNEFGKAGNYQVVKMVSGVTSKVGRFLFSPTARRILEQPKSTIDFDAILESGKILICNLAEGKLGEDTSKLLGTTIIAKIQQASMRRARISASSRTPFYLFVDEFQNFATSSFTKLLSGGRKFGLRITIAEQSTAQQDDRNVVNVILANTGTVVCFRTASPIDEELMLSQFSPYVKSGDIGNLPRFKFYIKLSAVEPEEPFSGETLPPNIEYDPEQVQRIIEATRKNYAIEYKRRENKHTQEKIKPLSKKKKMNTEKNDLDTLTV